MPTFLTYEELTEYFQKVRCCLVCGGQIESNMLCRFHMGEYMKEEEGLPEFVNKRRICHLMCAECKINITQMDDYLCISCAQG